MTRIREFTDDAWGPALALAGLLVIVAALGNANPVLANYLIVGLTSVIVVVGLYVFMGNSGIMSLGHVAFMAVGAYVGGILCIPPIQRQAILPGLPSWLGNVDLGLWPAAALSAAVAGVIGFLLSLPLCRLSHTIAVAVATLTVLEVVQVVLSNWGVVSEGGQATPGIPADATGWNTYGAVVIAVAAALAYQRSASGHRLRASREDRFAARAIGVNIVRERRVALTVSAAIVAFGGTFYAHTVGVVSPDDFYLTQTILFIAMLVVGGMTSLTGAIVGAVTISLVYDVFTQLEGGGLGPIRVTLPNGIPTVIIALILLGILIKRPAGLTGGREWRMPTLVRRRIWPQNDGPAAAAGTTSAQPTTGAARPQPPAEADARPGQRLSS